MYGMGHDEKEFESVGTHLPHNEKNIFGIYGMPFLTVNSMQ